MMKLWQICILSSLLTIAVVANAFHQKKHFYTSVVYLTKSSSSLGVLYFQAFILIWILAKIAQKLFFGPLRVTEVEHLFERSWYAVTETCLAFTVFRDDFSPVFVAQFAFLLFFKCFHWLAEDRVDMMERSPIVSTLFHIRMFILVGLLTFVDVMSVKSGVNTVLARGASAQLVFAFEYAILLTTVFIVAVKYVLHSMDLRRALPWDRKAVFLLYAELVTSFIRLLLYTAFMSLMLAMRVFALFAIRPTYLAVRAFVKATSDVIRSRIAVRNLNTLFPDALAVELQAATDTVCIICREDMLRTAEDQTTLVTPCKRLPCSHIFHAGCLRSWFQRQQTCPTCRADVVNVRPPAAQQAQAAAAAARRNAAAPQPEVGQARPRANGEVPIPPAPAAPNTGVSPAALPRMPMNGAPQLPPFGAAIPLRFPVSAIIPGLEQFGGILPGLGFPLPPPPPPFPLIVGGAASFQPMVPPVTTIPPNETPEAREARLAAELRARVECLESIRTLLDVAVLQLQNYLALSANAGSQTASDTSATSPTAPTVSQPAVPEEGIKQSQN